MNIPEITESQLKLAEEVFGNPNMHVFSQCTPKPGDDLQAAIEATQASKDAEYLCSLGFLKNITAYHQERIDAMNAESGRDWQVYEVMAMGRAMFQAAPSTLLN
jgi:hypothetical protein